MNDNEIKIDDEGNGSRELQAFYEKVDSDIAVGPGEANADVNLLLVVK